MLFRSREVCAQILIAEGYTVTTAASGKEAVELVKKHVFDAVVTDIMMPDMSGLELLEIVNKGNEEVCTVVITGLGTYEMATQSGRLGAREFVVKPFTPDELSEALSKALARN